MVRHLISKAGREYKTAVAGVVNMASAAQGLTGRLAVKIALYPPDRKARDIDNNIKATLDAMMAAGVFVDDSQIDHLEVARAEIVKNGAALVTVTGER